MGYMGHGYSWWHSWQGKPSMGYHGAQLKAKMLVDGLKSCIFLTSPPNSLAGFNIKGTFVQQLPTPLY